jgi:hypothetical protein
MIKEVKTPQIDISSKDDSPPPAERVDMTEEERYVKEVEEAFHNEYNEQADEEIDIEW